MMLRELERELSVNSELKFVFLQLHMVVIGVLWISALNICDPNVL